MIPANELRIGNWVKFNNASMQVEASDILAFDKNYLSQKLLYPIPLTPELLEKAGFRKYVGCYQLVKQGVFGDHLAIYYIPNKGVVIDVGDQDASAEKPLPHIQHLHQLQNLIFALSGTELEIKL